MKVVVFSWDAYSWLIPTFWHFYRKNWPDNPYKTEFVTETKKLEFGDFVFYGGKVAWVDRAIKYLKQFDEDKFLLFIDDYILEKNVDTDRVRVAENLCKNRIGCVKLTANPKHSGFLVDTGIKNFKEYPLDAPYSFSGGVAIWQTSFFLDILQLSRPGENIWQTEMKGSKRIQKFNKQIIWSDTPIVNCAAGGYMKKGKPRKRMVKWVKKNW